MEIVTQSLDNGNLFINRDFLDLLGKNRLLTARQIWNLHDESVKRVVEERATGRIFLDSPRGTKKIETYIKRYTRVPLSKRVKDAFSLKFFQFDAIHEWQAQITFHRLELPTVIPIAAGRLKEGTFNLTLGIKGYQRASSVLEGTEEADEEKRRKIIRRIGLYVGRMHKAGLAHQDLYLVHFFLKGKDMVPHLIDLQRVIREKELSDRWRIKDLGELLFSAAGMVSDQEKRLFCQAYFKGSGLDLGKHPGMIRAIEKKAARIEARRRRKLKRKTSRPQE